MRAAEALVTFVTEGGKIARRPDGEIVPVNDLTLGVRVAGRAFAPELPVTGQRAAWAKYERYGPKATCRVRTTFGPTKTCPLCQDRLDDHPQEDAAKFPEAEMPCYLGCDGISYT